MMGDSERAFLETALEYSPFVFFHADSHLNCIYVNQRFTEITGLTQAEARGQGWQRAFHPDDRARVAALAVHGVPAEGVAAEARLVRPDGSVRSISGRILPITDQMGGIIGYTGTMFDTTDERRMERRLREREQLFSTMFGNEHTIMFIADPETGELLEANPAAERFYGYSAEEFKRMRVWDITVREREAVLQGLARARVGLETHFPLQHRKQDGEVRDVEVRPAPVRYRGRDMLFVVVEDVTERKRAQEALRESEERYRRLVETSPDGVYVEVDRKFAYINAAALRMLGAQDADELLGREVLDLVHPDRRQFVLDRIRRVQEGGRNPLAENRYVRLDGTDLEVETTSALTEYRGQPAVQVIMRDVSARKRAEERESWSAAVIEGTTAGVVGLACDGTILSWNPSAERLFGVSAERAVGRNLRDFHRGMQSIEEIVKGICQGDSVDPVVVTAERAGRSVDIETSFSVVRGKEGEILGMSTIVRDVSSEKQLERAKDEFFAIASHELRTPLTTILGYATLLENGRRDEERLRAFASRIRGQAEHMGTLIDEMLQVLMVESPAFELDLGWVDVEALLTKCVEGLPEQDRERVIVEAPSIDVRCDATRLGMAISNLVGNALKFSDADSPVRVHVEEGDDELTIAVSDSGIGIAEDVRERIFERFRQADMSSRRGFGGFGLGLYIVKRVVESHGGSVEVASALGEGSTFTLHLPHTGEAEALRAG